mmetsp:Transcript_11872/g.13060  ORF Transcript_11872/g.13060 Transcript_11872/m.13060 type:complete len:203 (-) Transcript_11872:127-735(-)
MIDYTTGSDHSLPVFMSGISMGGCVSYLAALKLHSMIQSGDVEKQFSDWWRGTVLLCPAIFNSIEPPWIVKQMLLAVAAMGGNRLRLGPLPDVKKFDSVEVYNTIMADPHSYTGQMFLSTGKNLLHMTTHAQTRLKEAKFPFFICHGQGDPVVPCYGSEKLFKEAQSEHKVSKIYDDLPTHFIISRERVVDDVSEWISSRLT